MMRSYFTNTPVPSMENNLSSLPIIRTEVYACDFANFPYDKCIVKINLCPRYVSTGRRTCNSWFAYSARKDRKDIGPPPDILSIEEMEDYERLPRDYDKEVHDNLYHAHICECFVFVIAHIPG